MNQPEPITRDAEICKILTSLPEKFIVDFANGIDVARDHVREQRRRSGMFDRLYDGITGQGVRRQAEINSSLTDGVEGAFTWLTELTESVTISNYAIAQVNERVSAITQNVTALAHYSADTREQVKRLSFELTNRCDQLSKDIIRIDLKQNARIQLDSVFDKWNARRFNTFSRAGRCYAALEELRWGAFGDYCRENKQTRNGFLQDLTHKAIHQLNSDACIESSERPEIGFWIARPTVNELLPDATEALAYLGDWSNPDAQPFVHSITQLPRVAPLALPKLCNAERLAPALVSELFEEQYQ